MVKVLLGIAASVVVAACGTTTLVGAQDGGAGPSGGTSNPPLPSDCSPQPEKLARQYCEDMETLVACPAGASPTWCKRSVLADSFCCPPPPPSTDPRLQQLCQGLEKCSDFKNFECQELLEAERVSCATTFESLLRCASTGDACSSGERCAAAFASYYACKGAADNCTVSAEATTACARIPSKLGRSIAFSCASAPPPTGACASSSAGTNHFLCCEPAFLPSPGGTPPSNCQKSSVCINGACKCGEGPQKDKPCQKTDSSAADYCDTLCEFCQ